MWHTYWTVKCRKRYTPPFFPPSGQCFNSGVVSPFGRTEVYVLRFLPSCFDPKGLQMSICGLPRPSSCSPPFLMVRATLFFRTTRETPWAFFPPLSGRLIAQDYFFRNFVNVPFFSAGEQSPFFSCSFRDPAIGFSDHVFATLFSSSPPLFYLLIFLGNCFLKF